MNCRFIGAVPAVGRVRRAHLEEADVRVTRVLAGTALVLTASAVTAPAALAGGKPMPAATAVVTTAGGVPMPLGGIPSPA